MFAGYCIFSVCFLVVLALKTFCSLSFGQSTVIAKTEIAALYFCIGLLLNDFVHGINKRSMVIIITRQEPLLRFEISIVIIDRQVRVCKVSYVTTDSRHCLLVCLFVCCYARPVSPFAILSSSVARICSSLVCDFCWTTTHVLQLL